MTISSPAAIRAPMLVLPCRPNPSILPPTLPPDGGAGPQRRARSPALSQEPPRPCDCLRNSSRTGWPSIPLLQGAPDRQGTSRMSPYLHFGHISPVTIALAVRAARAPEEAKQKYLDQLITWRELAINFVHFQPLYDSIECAEPWAHKTLRGPRRRPAPYPLHARPTWSARNPRSALECRPVPDAHSAGCTTTCGCTGPRRFWSGRPRPRHAYQTAIYLNDKYFLDGRDPNGYAGVAWAIAGKFDRPWFNRPIFGVIRYMSGTAASRKFDAEKYIREMYELARPLPPLHGLQAVLIV